MSLKFSFVLQLFLLDLSKVLEKSIRRSNGENIQKRDFVLHCMGFVSFDKQNL